MDIKEFKSAFKKLISPYLAKHEIQQGVCFEDLFIYFVIKLNLLILKSLKFVIKTETE